MLIVLNHLRPDKRIKYHRLDEHLDTIIVHRIKVGTRATDIVNAFQGGLEELTEAFGGKVPYHFLVEPDGTWTQVVSLGYQTPHAVEWNPRSIAVGCIGDFRMERPSPPQWRAAILGVAMLAYPQGWNIMGHDEAPGGSSDPDKVCPGRYWDMTRFRMEVSQAGLSEGDVNSFWKRLRM